jgi:hypothetical protein
MRRKWIAVLAWMVPMVVASVAMVGCARAIDDQEDQRREELDPVLGVAGEEQALKGDDGEERILCNPGETLCASTCVVLQTSSTNCGYCGHDCGGGICAAGVCQAVDVADAGDLLDTPAALAVNGNSVIWSEKTRVRSCPLPAGCASTPTVIASGLAQLRSIAATNSNVYFSGCRGAACDDYHEAYVCPVTGCPLGFSRVARSIYGFYRILIGNTWAYWQESTEGMRSCPLGSCTSVSNWTLPGITDLIAMETDGSAMYLWGGGNLKTCPEGSSCASPSTLLNSSPVSSIFRAYSGSFYWWAAGSPNAEVRTCPISSCSGNTTVMTNTESNGAVEIEVDSTGVYWLNSTLGTIRHCPLGSTCPVGGPTPLVSGLVGIKELTLGAGFVYWIDGNKISKVAKL